MDRVARWPATERAALFAEAAARMLDPQPASAQAARGSVSAPQTQTTRNLPCHARIPVGPH